MAIAVHEAVLEAIRDEVKVVERIAGLLERERDILKQRDSDALNAITLDKETALTELAQAGKRRVDAVSNQGFATDESGMQAFLAEAPETEHLQEAWEELKEKLAACQRQNLVNGQVLNGTADHTRRLLSVLVGASSPDEELYDRQGGKVSHLGGRTHTKA